MVDIGQKAPDFRAPAVVDGGGQLFELFTAVSAHEAVVLLFYPADFVPACTAELVAVSEAGWTDVGTLAVVGVSGDSLFSHAAYADRYGLSMTLVSDFHSGVADSYDLLVDEWEGHAHIPARATVVIDSDWNVAAIERAANPLDHERSAPVERAAESLQTLDVGVETPAVEYENWGKSL